MTTPAQKAAEKIVLYLFGKDHAMPCIQDWSKLPQSIASIIDSCLTENREQGWRGNENT